MQVFIEGTAKEIADIVFLLQCQREMKRKPYSDELEPTPIIRDGETETRSQSECTSVRVSIDGEELSVLEDDNDSSF